MKNLFVVIALLSGFVNLSCKKEEIKNSEKEIISFATDSQVGTSTINATSNTVTVLVEYSVDLSAIAPTIIISENATIFPASEAEVDFSKGPVNYTVTAEDGSTKIWIVTISNAASNEAEILSFTLTQETENALIADNTVSSIVSYGTDLSSLTPAITISSGATISPSSGVNVDFSAGAVAYTVTAQDGTVKTWEITVNHALRSDKNILTYTVPGQIGVTTISNIKKTVQFEVPFGTDITTITPSITVSAGATISPVSGAIVNFSDNYTCTYTVTAEDGTIQDWEAILKYELIPADDPNFQYYGRIDFTNPAKPKFSAPGVYIKAKFTGSFCEIVINDQNLYGYNNYIDIVIDETERTRVQTIGVKNSILVADNLPAGEHTITICKDTEAGIGLMEFEGLRCEALVALPAKPSRKIEFIGNSITVGSSIDVSEIACETGEWYDQHNAYLSYGPLVARSLDAQWHLSAVSGIGMIHSCCNMDYVMPDVYEKINFAMDGANWDLSQYIPDAVVIILGQNDGIRDSTAFTSAYVDFIEMLRDNYPDAEIICATSPMADATLTSALKNYLTGITDHMNGLGDSKVSKFYFSTSYNSGCGTHPDMSEHQLIAGELETYLLGLLGW